MKIFRNTIIAMVLTLGSSAILSGCFVDDDEIFQQVESGSNNDGTGQDTNEDQWQ